jgi:hypothetical protein
MPFYLYAPQFLVTGKIVGWEQSLEVLYGERILKRCNF